MGHAPYHRSRHHRGPDEAGSIGARYALPAAILLVTGLCTWNYGGVILVGAVLLAALGFVAFYAFIRLTWAVGHDAARVVNFLRAESGRAGLERAMWLDHRAGHERRQLARVHQIRGGHGSSR